MRKTPGITRLERRTYVLKEPEDITILLKIKEVERCRLSKSDKKIVELLRSQLKKNWRDPLIHHLNTMLRRY
ncbi:MAG: hypothetical protein AABW65_02370 [Nanoarchaeota archaeon]